jgi:foldase protein PrsA
VPRDSRHNICSYLEVTPRMVAEWLHNLRSPAPSKAWAVSLAVALVFALAVTAVLGGCSNDVFTVNGQGISRLKFENEVNRRLEVVRKKNPKELEGARGQKLKASTEREVATGMIRRTLMEQQAARLGVGLAPDAVKQRIEIERQKAGYENFNSGLKKQGISLGAYEDKVRGELLVAALGNKVCANVSVTKDEAESYYLTNKDVFTRALMVHAAHILVDTDGEAQTVLDELKAGQDFGQVARSASRDTATSSAGGDLGWIEQGTLDPALESAAFGLKSGQVSAVVSASDGYHIIKVLERREASVPPFSDVWQEAMNKLETKKKEELFGDWLRTVYANARIDTGGLGKWDPRLGIVTSY